MYGFRKQRVSQPRDLFAREIAERSVAATLAQLSPDAVSEFKVQTNNFSAEYGRSGGAIVNVSVKSGDRRHVITAQRSFKRKGLGKVDLPLADFLAVIALAYQSLGQPAGASSSPSHSGGA